MTLKEYFIKALCAAPLPNKEGPLWIWNQLELALEERFLQYLRLNSQSKEVLEALYESITGKELSCLKHKE